MAPTDENPAAYKAHRVREIDQAGERVNREHTENHSGGQYRLITTVPKSAREEFRVGIRAYGGVLKCELRVFELDRRAQLETDAPSRRDRSWSDCRVIAGLCECEARL